jgi:hypothetical protein
MKRFAFALTLSIIAMPALAEDCQCRAGGQTYSQGQTACVFGKLSRCSMNQNVASWKVISGTCLVSEQGNEPASLPFRPQPVKQLIKAAKWIHVRAMDV